MKTKKEIVKRYEMICKTELNSYRLAYLDALSWVLDDD